MTMREAMVKCHKRSYTFSISGDTMAFNADYFCRLLLHFLKSLKIDKYFVTMQKKRWAHRGRLFGYRRSDWDSNDVGPARPYIMGN